MLARCSQPAHKSYRYYGAKGICVDPRWRRFHAFLSDLGPRPSHAHTLGRHDHGRSYEPGNVGWATRRQQANPLQFELLLYVKPQQLVLSL